MQAKIIGHQKIRNLLDKMIENDNIPSSFLFYGKEGIGKLLVAKEFAKKALCKNKIDEKLIVLEGKCNCESCRMFEKNVHPDFLLVNMEYQANLLNEKIEEQKSIGINTIRELIKFSNLKPAFSKKKFIIIDNAEKLTIEAQNSLLKTLEEPPEGTTIILVSSSKNLLPTVLSRCYQINFGKLSTSEVFDILVEKGYEFKKAEYLSKISEGSISTAVKYEKVLKLFQEYLLYNKKIIPFFIANRATKEKDLKEFTLSIMNFIDSYLHNNLYEENREKAISLIKENFKYRTYLRHNVNTKMILTVILYKFLNNSNFFEKGVRI